VNMCVDHIFLLSRGDVLLKNQVQSKVSLLIYPVSNVFCTTQIGILQNDIVHYEGIQFN
jgi:hypothetical protein